MAAKVSINRVHLSFSRSYIAQKVKVKEEQRIYVKSRFMFKSHGEIWYTKDNTTN